MRVIGIVPARMAATRFPGKPMALLHGMPMVGHCYHRTRLALGDESAFVATCDREIADYMREFGGAVIMTASTHLRATTRTAEALEHVERTTGNRPDVVIMVQGDEPLVLPETIAAAVPHFENPSVDIVNVMCPFESDEQFHDRNNVKVVVDRANNALYFSREPIPSQWKGGGGVTRYMQTGIIAFRRSALLRFNELEETGLERAESIDMNRVLESGGRVRMVAAERFSIGVDTAEELRAAEALMPRDAVLESYLA